MTVAREGKTREGENYSSQILNLLSLESHLSVNLFIASSDVTTFTNQ